MSELDNWRNSIQSLKFAYKDESTVSSNNADANFASDEPSEGTMELTNIDENRSYHSCIPMASDKYDVGKYSNNDFGLDSTMAGIIDVSSIYDDDDSDRNKLQLTQQDFFKIDTSELERKPTQDIQFDNADDLIHATEDLSVASGSETDGSSIIFNVWNEDYDGKPDPAVMERLTKAKKLPRGLDPFVVTQIKRAKIINKIKEIDDDDSSQGSCALMLDNVCMPRFCGNEELTDTGSVGSSLVESLREGSITASVEIDFFHHKRPKKTKKYALHSDRSFEPNKSPQELVLIVPKNQEVKENRSSVSSFLPVPIQQLTNEFDDDDTLDDGTYVEEDKEFTLQKYDRTPHRIAQLVLAGKKSEAKRYRVNETDNTADTTPSQPFVTPEEDVDLESHVIKAARFVEDEDPIECDRSFAGPSDESTSEEEIIEDEQTETQESSFAEFLKLFSDPNYVSPNIIYNIVEDEINEEEVENEGSREKIEVVGSQIACAPIAAGDNNEDAYEPMFAMGSKMACVSRSTVIDSDHVEPQEVPINQVLTTFSDLSEAGLGPEPTASTLTDACSLNPVGSSYSMNSPIQNRIASLDIANEINAEGGSSEGSMSFAGGQENCTPAIIDDTDITDSKIDLKITDAPKHNEPENTDNKDQVYVPGRRTISIAAINSSFFKEKPIETPKEITARPSLLHFATCCAPHTSLAVKDTDNSIQDLMAALDLTLEGVPTASYSTAGEEVVMASPLSEGIVADQPNSKYGRIIAPEEFAKLQESFYKSMGLDDTILTEHGLATEVCHDDRSNNPYAFTQEASDGDFEQKCESSTTETSSIEIIEPSEISVELEVIPSMPQAGCEIEANNKTKDQKQNQELKISTSSSDQFFFDSVESPSRLPLNNSPTKTEDLFSVADESKVDVAILDIIDDLKSEQTSEHTQPKQPIPMVKQKMAQPSKHTKSKQPVQNKMASIPESKSNNAASISTEAQNSTARRNRKKKTSQSSKRSLDSKAKKTEEGSIMDDLAALKRTMVKNSTRSKIRVKSGAGSLGMKSNSLLDNLPQRKKELNSS